MEAVISFPPVLTKRDFVRRYNAGEFGNRAPTWDTFDEFLASLADLQLNALYHIRNRVAGGKTWYNVPGRFVSDVYHGEVLGSGIPPSQVYFSAMAPTDKTLIQGEVLRRYNGLHFLYSTLRKPMRDALSEQWTEAVGVKAVALLRHFLNAASYDWLETLLERYPDHVVELSVYDCCWGTVPGHNTVIWEVRKY